MISSIYDCCMCGVTPPFSIKSWSWISETWSNWTTSSLSGKSKNRLQQKKIIVWIWHHKKAVPFPPLSTPTNFQTFFGQFYSSNIQTNLRLPDFLQQKIQQTYTIKFSYLGRASANQVTSTTPISYLRKDWCLPETNNFCTWKWRPFSFWDTAYVQGRTGC